MKITIKSKFGNYTVENINKLSFKKSENNFYLIDKNVYKKILKKNIKGKLIILDTSEKLKNYYEIGKIIKKLINLKVRKNSIIIAIGGGIVQDIAGFISSILFRGIQWNFYPSTLLSQGDSCIGAKTSINFAEAKNQLGNFYPPSKIFIFTDFLKFLKKKDIYSGLGELAHYFLVSNSKDWRFYVLNFEKFLKESNKNRNIILQKLTFKSLLIKKKFIEKDELDTGKRLILNYGHSFGHSIEKLTNYKIPHGLAVAHGINIANFFSFKLNLMNYKKFKEIEKIIRKIVNLNEISKLNSINFVNILKKDKKNVGNSFRLILSKGVGRMFVKKINNKNIFKNLLKDYLKYVQ